MVLGSSNADTLHGYSLLVFMWYVKLLAGYARRWKSLPRRDLVKLNGGRRLLRVRNDTNVEDRRVRAEGNLGYVHSEIICLERVLVEERVERGGKAVG